MQSNIIIIACSIFKYELEEILKNREIDIPVIYLNSMLHMYPEQLEKAIAKLVNNLMSGEYLLIEEKEPNKEPRKLVAQSLDSYLKYLPEGTEYKIENKI